MKKTFTLPIYIFLLCLLTLFGKNGLSQGRVVINEFMPWSLNTCNVNGEFIELMNFGPGPMNIGCYMVTNGKYSVTIPPNTIIQPGEFYVIAGSNSLPQNCGNIDSTVQVKLNWNTCNCTNLPIPTTGDGFFADGGGANEKVILMNPFKQIIDAVTRNSPPTSSDPITTPTLGTCTSNVFDLDTMNIRYEVLGMSTGIGNSFARTIDGDCQWVKDTKQSANATNNRTGDVSAVQYTVTMTQARDCGDGGSIDIQVNIVDGTVTDYNRMFPMNYAIAYDANGDDLFDLINDVYTYGADSTSPSIDITGLPRGRYRIVVGSVLGCFLASFDIRVLRCDDETLRAQLLNFNLVRENSNSYLLKWMLTNPELIRDIVLEKSNNNSRFISHHSIPVNFASQTYLFEAVKEKGISYYRLKITGTDGHIMYSPVISTPGNKTPELSMGPNPVRQDIKLKLEDQEEARVHYKIYGALNQVTSEGYFSTVKGVNHITIPTNHLSSGVYQLMIYNKTRNQPISFRFVKP